MIDAKLTTLLTLIEAQSYTKAAQMLSLTCLLYTSPSPRDA